MNKSVLIVSSGEGDWKALYINGNKVYENHSIPVQEILKALEVEVDYYTYPEEEDPDNVTAGRFPAKWKK